MVRACRAFGIADGATAVLATTLALALALVAAMVLALIDAAGATAGTLDDGAELAGTSRTAAGSSFASR
jgi:hypothetical protein